jgi:hypothetical protein
MNLNSELFLAEGTETTAFSIKGKPKRVLLLHTEDWYEMRQGNFVNDPTHILDRCPKYQLYLKFPKYFPKVHEVDKAYLVVEKMDTERAYNELLDIQQFLDISLTAAINNFFTEVINPHRSQEHRQVISKLRPYGELLARVRSLLTKRDLYMLHRDERYFDVHEENWGYDSKGTLKLLDL